MLRRAMSKSPLTSPTPHLHRAKRGLLGSYSPATRRPLWAKPANLSPILPERMSVAHLGQSMPDLQHGRVCGQYVERLAWGGGRQRRLYGLCAVGDDRANGKIRVLEPHGHVFGPDPADGERSGIRFALLPRVGEHLEVHVPEPRDIAAVGVVVVYGDQDIAGFCAGDEGAQDLVEPDRVLYEQQEGLSVPSLYSLDPPESPTELPEAAGDLRQPDPCLPGHRGSGEGVVDVVETGEPYSHVSLALRGRELEP